MAKVGRERLTLWAFQQNGAALRFYAREGFAEIARTDGAGNEAACRMCGWPGCGDSHEGAGRL